MDMQYVVSKGQDTVTKGDWVDVRYGGVLVVGKNPYAKPETILAPGQWDAVFQEEKE